MIFLSTLSLRRATKPIPVWLLLKLFLSTLSLRRATVVSSAGTTGKSNFYPRSPCGERPFSVAFVFGFGAFLSTLSLRRATYLSFTHRAIDIHFYPRSPCGERRRLLKRFLSMSFISIHALLAESDKRNQLQTSGNRHFYPRSPCGERLFRQNYECFEWIFLSTLSLRRATIHNRRVCFCVRISIHALLAESDHT